MNVLFYKSVPQVDKRGHYNGNGQLNAVAHQARCYVGVDIHFAGGIKGNAQYNKSIEELRDNGRAGAAQPYHFSTGFIFKEMKNRNIY